MVVRAGTGIGLLAWAVMVISPVLALADGMSDWRAAREAQFAAFRAERPAAELWDAPLAPRMRIVPPGQAMIGAPAQASLLRGNELPTRAVRFERSFAVGEHPVTVGEFDAFTAETGHRAADQCWTFEDEEGRIREGRSWRNPGFAQVESHPVLCVSLDDVRAYIAWISARTGHPYRLLSEAEYEYVNRAGAQTDFWWGQEVGANHANCDGCGSLWDNRRTSPVGSFAANPFGLYDTTGDTWVWTSDCYVDPKAAPGGPVDPATCEHAIRGGAWHGTPPGSRVFSRFHHTPDTHSATLGFRLARDLGRA